MSAASRGSGGPDLRGPAVIVDGSVLGGFTFVGPFDTVEAASEWHARKRLAGYLGLPTTIVLLEKPRQDDAGSAPSRGSVANRLAESLRDMNDAMLASGADYSDILLDAARELDRRSWIAVSERLPPVNEPVLYTCYIDDTDGYWIDVDVGCWDGNERNAPGNPIMRDRYGARSDTHWSPCSHWMPLPH